MSTAPKTDLAQRCSEIIDWRMTGLYRGVALQRLAETLPEWDSDDALRRAEEMTIREALCFTSENA